MMVYRRLKLRDRTRKVILRRCGCRVEKVDGTYTEERCPGFRRLLDPGLPDTCVAPHVPYR